MTPPGPNSVTQHWDVVIVGGGPAGLSAALVLGRCCRRVLVCDRGTPRSWASRAMYGYLTRDGVPPRDFRRLAIEELGRYPDVKLRQCEVVGARRTRTGFSLLAGKTRVQARRLLIATGVMDTLPPIEGLAQAFGTSVFQCPYCDGWEFRGQPVAVYGKRQKGLEMARALTAWTDDIVLASGEKIARTALFFDTPSRGQSTLTQQLGCKFTRHGGVLCGRYEATTVPGVYVAGNLIRNVQLSIVAAAEGANAAFGINRSLTREDFELNAG